MDPREEVFVTDRDRQEGILVVCRKDEVRGYLKVEDDVGDGRGSVAYGPKNKDESRTPSKDEIEHVRYTLGTSEKENEGGSPWRDELNPSDGEVEWSTSAKDEENDYLETHGKEDERDTSSSCEKDDQQNTSTKNESYSLDVGAKEDEHDCLNTDGEKDGWDASTKRDIEEHRLDAFECFEKEVEWNSLKQHEGKESNDALERVRREEGGTLLWSDGKQRHSFTSRDKKETYPGFLERDNEEDDPNALRREIEEVRTQMPNCQTVENEFHNLKRDGREEDLIVNENEDENRVFEKDGENDPSLSLKDKDDEQVSPRNETKVSEQSVRKPETPVETGEQDLSSSVSGAVRVARGAFQNIYFSGPVLPQPPTLIHRRTQSETGTPGLRRTNSFQRLKTQMQKAWRGVSNLREDSRPSFNPEVLADQKRQWYQLHSSKALDRKKFKEPTSLFEHFIIVGLRPETNLEAVEQAFHRRKKWEMEMSRYEVADYKILRHRGPQLPILEPQILFRYPPGKLMAMRPKDLATFCFPGGVKARLLERTPSLSDLNELVYGQEHLGTDDSSFIFSFKVANDSTLYGVCLHVSEIVQRPPGVLSTSSPLHSRGAGSRFLVSAPRCYCLLTRVPFFELHFEMLNSMIAQERLKRITDFVSEMSIAASCCTPSPSRPKHQANGNADSPVRNPNDWMDSAIPVDSVIALTAAAAGFISDDDIAVSSQKIVEPWSPDSVTNGSSDAIHAKEIERDGRKGSQCYDDNSSEASETRLDIPEKMYKDSENGHTSPEVKLSDSRIQPMEGIVSADSMFSSVRSVLSDEVDDGGLSNSENDFGDDLIMEWARDHKNDSLQIVCGYHSLAVPSRGDKILFQPLDHLQAIEYMRPSVSSLGLSEEYLDSFDAAEVNARLAAVEEALALSTWTTATICRVLSLETIMVLLAGVLLEKQVVVACPNLFLIVAGCIVSYCIISRPIDSAISVAEFIASSSTGKDV
ncbi:PREDICTED: uncharacterized protein LOC104820065 isoform X2 [Tarenaya hassleriana]|uniref:uncharacterized protein LOC104820065 isoform X2 n=1 Tax=Tarenaya hassleriana TaxID=28532 RepID=UPI00053C5622|nr:PREDICTED: uncharacterized protein LOC104820065 isoform X2 [Tarenaya hassleriana]